jgi:hypothetical protein
VRAAKTRCVSQVMAMRPTSKNVASSWLSCFPLAEGEFDCFLWCQICAEYWRRIKLEFIIEVPCFSCVPAPTNSNDACFRCSGRCSSRNGSLFSLDY